MIHCNRQLAPNPLLVGNHSSTDAVDGVIIDGLVAARGSGTPTNHKGEANILQLGSSNTPGQWGRVCSWGHSEPQVWRSEVLQHNGTAGILLWLSNST